jgi:hypothetical protein
MLRCACVPIAGHAIRWNIQYACISTGKSRHVAIRMRRFSLRAAYKTTLLVPQKVIWTKRIVCMQNALAKVPRWFHRWSHRWSHRCPDLSLPPTRNISYRGCRHESASITRWPPLRTRRVRYIGRRVCISAN